MAQHFHFVVFILNVNRATKTHKKWMEECQLNWIRVNGAPNRWTNERTSADCSLFPGSACFGFFYYYLLVYFFCLSFFLSSFHHIVFGRSLLRARTFIEFKNKYFRPYSSLRIALFMQMIHARHSSTAPFLLYFNSNLFAVVWCVCIETGII